MKEAERMLTRAIDLLEPYENRSRVHVALINRGAIRGMLGDREEALQDCERVLVDDERDEAALRNKGLLLLQMDRASEAIQYFEKISQVDERTAVALPLAAAYLETGFPRKTIEALAPVWKPDTHDRQQIGIADLLLAAHTRLGDARAVDEVLRVLTEMWPSEPIALATIARPQRREGHAEEATDRLREALSYATGPERDFIAADLADLYYANARYAEAAEVYEQIIDKR
jgi:tetratricopeptide (TPR) repeat protein